MQEIIDARHFNELIAYEKVRKPDAVRFEYYLAYLLYVLINVNRPKEKGEFPIAQVVFDKPKNATSKCAITDDDDMAEFFKTLCVAMGGSVQDGNNR